MNSSHLSTADVLKKALTGAVPASYVPLINHMVFYIEPDVSCSRFFGMACFTKKSLEAYRKNPGIDSIHLLQKTELGGYIATHLQDGLFIDIPCGQHSAPDPTHDFAMIPLVGALGATTVWEIDKTSDVILDRFPNATDIMNGGHDYQLCKRIGDIVTRIEGHVSVATAQDDILGFITKISTDVALSPKAIYLSGIQPDADFCKRADQQRDVAIPYLYALYDELARVCNTHDLVILNSGNMLVEGIDENVFPTIHPSIALPPRGFTLIRRCAYDKVQVYKKD